MQTPQPERIKRPSLDAKSGTSTAPQAPTRRAIDCGVSRDDQPARGRMERAEVRHAYVTSRGTYADQAQAI